MMRVDLKRLSEAEVSWRDRNGDPINIDRAWQKSDARIVLTRKEQAMLAAAGMDGPEARWYVLRVDNGSDKAVDKALEDANVERWMAVKSILPPRRSGRKKQRSEPVLMPALPGYLFVRVVSTPCTWAGLQTIDGIAGVLGGADIPSPVSDREVLKLKAFIEKDPTAIEVMTNALKAGDSVTVDDGPFAMFPGIVEAVREHGRVLVEVMIFGRAVPVDLDLAQVCKTD